MERSQLVLVHKNTCSHFHENTPRWEAEEQGLWSKNLAPFGKLGKNHREPKRALYSRANSLDTALMPLPCQKILANLIGSLDRSL